MKRKTAMVFWVALFAAGAFGLMRLRGHHANLRKELADLQRRSRAMESTQRENERLKSLIAQTERTDADATNARQRELARLRAEVSDLEKRAAVRNEQKTTETIVESAALANNRDPERGMTRLEHFQNIGRATPAAAFQTLVWAALKGADTMLLEVLALSPEAQAKADALLARLPAAAREKFPNAESLAAMAVTGEMMKGNALEIAGYTFTDGSHALVQIRTPAAKEAKLPMQLSPGGWQLIVPDRAIDGVERKMGEMAANLPPKK
jgi:hypothetical protein